jgi:hypothetical protein
VTTLVAVDHDMLSALNDLAKALGAQSQPTSRDKSSLVTTFVFNTGKLSETQAKRARAASL